MRLANAAPALALVAGLALAGTSFAQEKTGGAEEPQKPEASKSDAQMVRVRDVKVRGKERTVLTDEKGFTLYYLTLDTPTTVACRRECLEVWIPVTVEDRAPEHMAGLPGTFTTIVGPNDSRVLTYNGHPLYRYTGDQSVGEANGEGRGGQWFVATPDLQPVTPSA